MTLDGGILDQVTLEFLGVFTKDATLIQHSARMLFYYLVVIQLALSSIWMSIAGESLQRFVSKMVQLSFSFGFFYALIQMGGTWIPSLVNGFIEIGQQGGVTSLDPSSVLGQGVSISGAIFKGFFGWGLLGHPFVSLVGAAVCVGIIIIYALIAAELTVILVKSYAIIALGGLFFAFGASEYTNQMAKNYFKTAIGLGIQLMTLYLILGVGQNVGSQWAVMTAKAAQQHQMMPMLVITGAVIVYYLIVKNVPPFIAGIAGVSGFRNYGDAAVGMAVNAGLNTANVMSRATTMSGRGIQGATEAARVGMHGFNAFKAGSSQAISGGGNPMRGGLSNLSKTLATAGANTVKDMATRQNQHLTFGKKLNHHLANKVSFGGAKNSGNTGSSGK